MGFKIENIFKAKTIFEANIAIGGCTYLVIFGEHINGAFCCVPNWGWGCEMSSDPKDIAYNCEQLIQCGASPEVAKEIAKAIKEICCVKSI